MLELPEKLNADYIIPPKPEALQKLQRLLDANEPDIMQLAEVISKDIGLSAMVLKTINSSMYNFRRQITDIKQSIVMLGCDFAVRLATFYFLKASMLPSMNITLERFWDAAERRAYLTTLIIEGLELSSEIPFEDAYTAGLFIDCGIPVMALKHSNYRGTLETANCTKELLFTDIEDAEHDSNHAAVGFHVAQTWDLPEVISELIFRHHDADFLSSNKHSIMHRHLFAIIKLAENILNKLKYSEELPEWEHIKGDILEHFGLTDDELDELESNVASQYALVYSDSK